MSLHDLCNKVKFRVGEGIKGSELINSKLYFPIQVVATEPESLSDFPADILDKFPVPPYCTIGTKKPVFVSRARQHWPISGNSLVVNRRYSEFLALRNLLILIFPQLIIPVLLLKSTAKNELVKSTEGVLAHSPSPDRPQDSAQNHCILSQDDSNDLALIHGCGDSQKEIQLLLQRFLNELSEMPELIFYCDFVQGFFTVNRDDFERDFFPYKIKRSLSRLQNSVAAINELRDVPQRDDSNLFAKGVDTMKSAVKNVFDFFSRQSSPEQNVTYIGETPGYSQLETSVKLLPEIIQRANDETAHDEMFVAWQSTARLQYDLFLSLRACALTYNNYFYSRIEMNDQLLLATEAFSRISEEYNRSPAFQLIEQSLDAAGLLVRGLFEKQSAIGANSLAVIRPLLLEAYVCEAAHNAISFMLAFWKYSVALRHAGNSAELQFRDFTTNVSSSLHSLCFLENGFQSKFAIEHRKRLEIIPFMVFFSQKNHAANVSYAFDNYKRSTVINLEGESDASRWQDCVNALPQIEGTVSEVIPENSS